MSQAVTIYEVYDQRALTEDIRGLVLLDRDTNLKPARTSARRWGGCVVKVEALVTCPYPFARDIISWKVVFTHSPRRKTPTQRDEITHKNLMGKLRQEQKGLYRSRHRPR